MNRNITELHLARLRGCACKALWLLKIMLPVSFAVTLLQYYGALDYVARFLDPLFSRLGLPGYSAIAFITAASLTTYAGIGVLTSLALTLREATIISLMMLLCHALPMECAVTHRTGSSFWGMVALRISMAFAAALLLNLVLPEMNEPFGFASAHSADAGITAVLENWMVANLKMSAMIFGIIYFLMVLQQVLMAYRLITRISRLLRPLMRVFGLPENAAYFWLVGNVLGISYGGAVMYDCLQDGNISHRSAVAVSMLFGAAVSAVVFVLARPLMLIFVQPEETEILAVGVQYLRTEGAFYCLIALLFLLYGFYRAIERPGMSVVLTVISLGLRVVLAYALSAIPALGAAGIWVSIPIGWVIADVAGCLPMAKFFRTLPREEKQ